MSERDEPVVVSESAAQAVGIIVMRVPPARLRAVGLLNHLETEARIRYIEGFRGASFSYGTDGGTIFEYVQWDGISRVGALLGEPMFTEHLAVMGQVDDTTEQVGFYECVSVVRPDHPAGPATISGRDGHALSWIVVSGATEGGLRERLDAFADNGIRTDPKATWVAVHRMIEDGNPFPQEPGVTTCAVVMQFANGSDADSVSDLIDAARLTFESAGDEVLDTGVATCLGSTVPDIQASGPMAYSLKPTSSNP